MHWRSHLKDLHNELWCMIRRTDIDIADDDRAALEQAEEALRRAIQGAVVRSCKRASEAQRGEP